MNLAAGRDEEEVGRDDEDVGGGEEGVGGDDLEDPVGDGVLSADFVASPDAWPAQELNERTAAVAAAVVAISQGDGDLTKGTSDQTVEAIRGVDLGRGDVSP